MSLNPIEEIQNAARNGDIEKVKNILKSNNQLLNSQIDIQFFLSFLVLLQNYLIIPFYTLLRKMVISKSSNFYYHNQVSKSTAKQFSFSIIYKIFIFDYLWYFHFGLFITFSFSIIYKIFIFDYLRYFT